MSLNVRRRHLDESQRAVLASRIANLRDGQRKSGTSIEVPQVSQADAAALCNVSVAAQAAGRVVTDATLMLARLYAEEKQGAGNPNLILAANQELPVGKVAIARAADMDPAALSRWRHGEQWRPLRLGHLLGRRQRVTSPVTRATRLIHLRPPRALFGLQLAVAS